ncbi:hypothetical protein [Desulfovibrio piger]|uniref:hypothetical protein n=1 Tax=Desulfovibrio piger TaxID=901 RepID=UPI0026F30990|nr:hypothetical protein [Desulfovibrio piger]
MKDTHIDFSNPPKVYGYDSEGIFTHTEICSPDPLESAQKGEAVWLMPTHTTAIEPPAPIEKHVRVFKNGTWEQMEDNRGVKYWLPGDTWQTEPHKMKDLGPLPDGATTERPEKPFSQIKIDKLGEINALYQQAIATLTPTYPDDERLTFDKQEQEARAWMADKSASTPFIDALAVGRQMDKAELVKRIILKADAFALASGSLTGQRQRYEDMLDVAETADAVAAIVPQYSLPGMEAQA